MTSLKISQPKPLGYYFNSPLPPELEGIDEQEFSLEEALFLCQVASYATFNARLAFLELEEVREEEEDEIRPQTYSLGSAFLACYVSNEYSMPGYRYTSLREKLEGLTLTCKSGLEFLAWCQDLASCHLRDSLGH